MTKKAEANKRKSAPNSGQFQKGHTGNPAGRPKGSKNLSTVLKKELASSITIRENGKIKKISKIEAVGKAHVAKAMQGDAQHTKLLMSKVDNMEGTGASFSLVITEENRRQILNRHTDRMREWILKELANKSEDGPYVL